ncbi:MAG: class I SAM-dependent methyltransferase [Polyangiales bacterium]
MTTRAFPNWHELYRDQTAESLPWYYPGIDPDLDRALNARHLTSGRALDLGTGPATQAMALAERGFEVVGSDLSGEAITQAKQRFGTRNPRVRFVQDDIVNSTLSDQFDLVLDRGCFHVLAPEQRARYAQTLAGLVVPEGHLFLKCFSEDQPGDLGPYRFSPREIEATFKPAFEILSIERTIYQGTLDPPPQALFCILRRAS